MTEHHPAFGKAKQRILDGLLMKSRQPRPTQEVPEEALDEAREALAEHGDIEQNGRGWRATIRGMKTFTSLAKR
jgi:hypothetical protein